MSYPRFYSEVKQMALERALETPVARAIARRGNLKQRASSESTDLTRTVILSWVDPKHPKESRQWDVDLTGSSAIRFVVTGTANTGDVYLFQSQAGYGSGDLDPGDYDFFPTLFPDDPYDYPTPAIGAQFATSEVFDGNPWAAIPSGMKRPLRLSLSLTLGAGWTWDTSSGMWPGYHARGFFVGAQIR